MKNLNTFSFKDYIISVLSFIIITLIIIINEKENDRDDNYITFPVATKDTKPCAFEIWKINDEEEEQFIRRVYFCEE